MTITSKWFLCLYLNHGAFSYDFLPYPIEEGEIKSSWPRSALNTTEEQEIIQDAAWEKEFKPWVEIFIFWWTSTTPLHKHNSTKDFWMILFPYLSGQWSHTRNEKRHIWETQWFLKKRKDRLAAKDIYWNCYWWHLKARTGTQTAVSKITT